VHIAIDDFGTGYSSLAYLKRFPVELLKIDTSFVAGLGSDTESDAIVAAIISLAQSLHLRTIAEGVETREQMVKLRELGCELFQGFLFSKALPPDELAASSAHFPTVE
jgi:EAL domain-containing protein (putative c-di-GMP-specific phosphodiesterase class I)